MKRCPGCGYVVSAKALAKVTFDFSCPRCKNHRLSEFTDPLVRSKVMANETKAKQLFEEFNALKSDKEKWLWVKAHQEDGILVNLDNDDTFVTIRDHEGYAQFNDYIGSSEGIFGLLRALGVKVEGV